MKRLIVLMTAVLALAGGCSESGRETAAPERVAVRFGMAGVSADVRPAADGGAAAVSGSARVAASLGAGSGLSEFPAEGNLPTRAVAGEGVGEQLAAGTTVRILAYRRAAGASGPDIAQDAFVTQNTYVAGADGSLSACTVDDWGVSQGSSGAEEMYLRPGDYDFYAVTPALPSTDLRTVETGHGVDLASSLTVVSGQITPQTPAVTVPLTVLDRKCSLLEFSTERKQANVSDIEIKQVTLTGMTHSPVTVPLNEDIPASALESADGSVTLEGDRFTMPDPSKPYERRGEIVVLPKKAEAFTLKVGVWFNGDKAADKPVTELAATVGANAPIAFKKGFSYAFRLVFRGNGVLLTLTVTPWNDSAQWDTDLGEYPSFTVEVGEWEIAGWEDSDVGGYLTPVFGVDSWKENPGWSTDLGGDD